MPKAASHTHWQGGPAHLGTRKACEEEFADWQAMQQVVLAQLILAKHGKPMKGKGMIEQLTQMFAGERETIVNNDGNESQTPFTQRLIRAYKRYQAEGPGPGWHLYTRTQEVNHAG